MYTNNTSIAFSFLLIVNIINLRDNRDLLDKISEYLLEKETIFGDEFMEFVYEKYPELKEKKVKKVELNNSNEEVLVTINEVDELNSNSNNINNDVDLDKTEV